MLQTMRNSMRVVSPAGWTLIVCVAALIGILEFGLRFFVH